jgi:hypothetical protein
MESYFRVVLNDPQRVNYGESTMSGKVLSLPAGAATNEVAFLTAISVVDVSRLTAISNFTLGFLNGVPQPLHQIFTP